VEPEVFVAVAVVDAVDHDSAPLELRVPASRPTAIKDDRPDAVLGQSPCYFPHQPFAFLLVGCHRILVDQLVDLYVLHRRRSSRRIAGQGRRCRSR